MKVQEIDGKVFTRVDEYTFVTETGTPWTLAERDDMIDTIRWANKELAKLAKKDLTDWDNACYYSEVAEVLAETEEDLWIANQLWDL